MVLILVIGMTVDLTGMVNAQQRAHDIAAQAARAAANQVAAESTMQGVAATVDPAKAQTAAQAYLAAAGVSGTVSVTGPASLTVTVQITYQPRFLGSVGVGPKTVTGSASVTLSRVFNGVPR